MLCVYRDLHGFIKMFIFRLRLCRRPPFQSGVCWFAGLLPALAGLAGLAGWLGWLAGWAGWLVGLARLVG